MHAAQVRRWPPAETGALASAETSLAEHWPLGYSHADTDGHADTHTHTHVCASEYAFPCRVIGSDMHGMMRSQHTSVLSWPPLRQ